MNTVEQPKPMASRLAALVLLVLSTAAAIMFAEFGLRFAVNPADFLQATLIDDPVLGHRIPPLTTGHDALGYRNTVVPKRADIVAIGDSNTYGVSAPGESSWPQQLGRLLGENVYNMALGGYGPLQYLYLAQTSAKAMKPRLLVIGFYFGNDLMDSFNLPHARSHWHGWRMPGGVNANQTAFDVVGQAEPKKRFGALRDWLSHHSLLYSVLRATVLPRFAAEEQARMAQQAGRDTWMLWKDPADPVVRTSFKPKHRLSAIDLELAPVREGMQISQRAFVELKAEAQRQGIGLLTVLVPTKERAYCRYLAKSGETLPESFARLCVVEAQTNAEFTAFLDIQGMAHLDLLPTLEARIDQHVQVYPTDSDGHPQAAGYAAIAEAIAATIQQRFPKR